MLCMLCLGEGDGCFAYLQINVASLCLTPLSRVSPEAVGLETCVSQNNYGFGCLFVVSGATTIRSSELSSFLVRTPSYY